MTTQAETTTANGASAPAEVPADLGDIVERLQAAETTKGADKAAPSETKPEGGNAKPDAAAAETKPEAKEGDKPADEAASKASATYEKAIEAEKRARADREAAKAELDAAKREREAHAKELADARAEAAEGKKLLRLVKEDPRELVRRSGMTAEAFVKALAVGARVPGELTEVQEKLERLEKERQAEKKAAEEAASKAQAEAQERARHAAVEEFTRTVKTGGEKWGVTQHYLEKASEDAIGLLEDVVRGFHEKHGRMPGFDEAADQLEQTLEDDTIARLSIPKLRAKVEAHLGAKPKATEPEAKKDAKPNEQPQRATGAEAGADGPRTLTHEHATSAGAGNSEKELSEEERFERMVARLEAAKR